MSLRRLSPRSLVIGALALIVGLSATIAFVTGVFGSGEAVPSFRAQACGLPTEYLERTVRGYFEPRSGQIAILPHEPVYMASGAGGWSHSGPWPYLQDIPIVFYGPGIIEAVGDVDLPVTMADVAPTFATLMKGAFRTTDGASLDEVARLTGRTLRAPPPKLIMSIVWDGGGWNVLEQWPDAWPNLGRMMDEGVTYTRATDGSSPSVTPAVHTTLGTGVFPWRHGITGVPVRDESGEVVDAFLKGESSRFLQVPALAERWDEANGNRAEIGMVGYEPWHLGMIGQGAERTGGDKDDAAWLDIDTNEWITNSRYYSLPPELQSAEGLEEGLDELDTQDGTADESWRGEVPLDDPARLEETPAWIGYHTTGMLDMIKDEGYGDDAITDLVFTNYKQIDRVGHYFNMDSELVEDSLTKTDAMLPVIERALNKTVGKGKWVMMITADHGQQPDEEDIDGYGISPREIEHDITAEFGPVVRAVWPTEVFLLEDAMKERGVTVEEIARFLGGYTRAENATEAERLTSGATNIGPDDRLFDMAMPARLLESIECEEGQSD